MSADLSKNCLLLLDFGAQIQGLLIIFSTFYIIKLTRMYNKQFKKIFCRQSNSFLVFLMFPHFSQSILWLSSGVWSIMGKRTYFLFFYTDYTPDNGYWWNWQEYCGNNIKCRRVHLCKQNLKFECFLKLEIFFISFWQSFLNWLLFLYFWF